MSDSQKDPSDRTRRSLLRSVSAGTVTGAVGLSGINSATEQDRQEAKDAKPSQILLEKLNNPTIRDTGVIKHQHGKAVILHTDIGHLVYADVDGEQKGAQFHVQSPSTGKKSDVIGTPDSTRSLPKSGTVINGLDYGDIPDGGKAVLVVNTDWEIDYIRDVAREEQRRLQKLTGVDRSRSQMIYSSAEGGVYEVHTMDGSAFEQTSSKSSKEAEGPKLEQLSERDIHLVRFPSEASLEQASADEIEVETIDEVDDITTNVNKSDCLYWAKQCANSGVVCVTCTAACIAATITTIAGAVTCIACMWGCSFAIPYSCSRAAQECDCDQCN